jgi:ataxin-3
MVLQGPFFSKFDLAALASHLNRKECQMMMFELKGGGGAGAASGDLLSVESHNISLDKDFSIQVPILFLPLPISQKQIVLSLKLYN